MRARSLSGGEAGELSAQLSPRLERQLHVDPHSIARDQCPLRVMAEERAGLLRLGLSAPDGAYRPRPPYRTKAVDIVFGKTIIDVRPSEETSMDVGVWLRSLGLGQYEATFRDNEIDGAVLPRLTVDDLKELGVAVVGHRRKIMSAIEELNADAVARADAMKPTQAHAPPSFGPSSGGAERRPITVMFCDLVGSTSMAAKLDAEDWRTLVNTYLDEASAAVTALGGHVLKKLGDGLMALFGYPHAQENDAERAVRAALAIQRALVESTPETPAEARLSLPPGSALIPGRSWLTQRAKCSAMRPILPRVSRAPPSRARS
jgi:hypothetical protein